MAHGESTARARKFGRYRLTGSVRSTPRRSVYRADSPDVRGDVELHIAEADPEDFLVRAHRLAALRHPTVLPIHEVGVHEGRAFAAAAPADGGTLERRLERGRLETDEALHIGADLAPALEALDRAGVRLSRVPPDAVVMRGDRPLIAPLAVDAQAHPAGESSPGTALASLLRSLVDPQRTSPGLRLLLSDPPPSAADLVERARGASPQRPRMPGLPLIGVAVAAMLAATTAVVLIGGGDTAEPPPPDTPAGRVAETIELGAEPTSVAVGEGSAWVGTTDGRLLRVDPETDEPAGRPIDVPGAAGDNLVRTGAGAVFVIGHERVARVDPATSRVTAQRGVGGRVTGATVAAGTVWITRLAPAGEPDRAATVVRLSARDLAPVGKPLETEALPRDVDVGAGAAWVANSASGSATRADPATGRSSHWRVGAQAASGAVQGDTYWASDPIGGYLTRFDTAGDGPSGIVRLPSPVSLAADGNGLWVTSARSPVRETRARLYRVDGSSVDGSGGRVVGRPVELGRGAGAPAIGEESVWVPVRAERALVRIEPTLPAPAGRAQREPAPGLLRGGPLPGGSWRSSQFALPFEITLGGRGWVAAGNDPAFASIARVRPTDAAIDLAAPDAAIGPDGGLVPVESVSQLVAQLRRDPRLIVRPLAEREVGGLPAQRLRVTARRNQEQAPAYCDRPCAPVLAAGPGTLPVEFGQVLEMALVEREGKVVAVNLVAPEGSPELARLRSALATLRFR